MKVWICWTTDTEGQREIGGIYSSRERAVARCRKDSDCVTEGEIDVDLPDEPVPWLSMEWPLRPGLVTDGFGRL